MLSTPKLVNAQKPSRIPEFFTLFRNKKTSFQKSAPGRTFSKTSNFSDCKCSSCFDGRPKHSTDNPKFSTISGFVWVGPLRLAPH